MRKKLYIWQLSGFIFTSVFGTLLHFVYEWTKCSKFVAAFSAVNESTWEHLKLLFFPMFLFAVIQSFVFREYKNFWCVKLAGILLSLITVPIFYYTYNGAFGKSPEWFNIATFFIAAALTYILETYLLKNGRTKCLPPLIAISLIVLIGILFVIYTYNTPKIPIFKDPLNKTYGLEKIPVNSILYC